MKSKGNVKNFISDLFKRLAKRAGVRVNIEPKWRVVGQIVGRGGKKTYFRNTSFDLNTIGATEIAIDKDYAGYFLKLMGYPVITGKAFFSVRRCKAIGSNLNPDAAYRYARKLGFPVVVKPNSQSQGRGVTQVQNKSELFKALSDIFKYDRVALVQKVVAGKDYRIVVLDRRIISAYERQPLSVVGDGKSSIAVLLNKKQRLFRRQGRDTQISFEDPRIARKLRQFSMSLQTILPKGVKQYLLDNANLSTGGDAVDVTKSIHPSFRKLAVALTADMGLRFCGVDLMIQGDIKNAVGKYWVIEINAAPGLDHYFASGKAQKKIVEDLYLKVLKSMA